MGASVCRELAKAGFNVSKRRILRLMNSMQLVPKNDDSLRKRRWLISAFSGSSHKFAQEFIAAKPNEKWVFDITYIPTQEGWLYMAVILDLYSPGDWPYGPSFKNSAFVNSCVWLLMLQSKNTLSIATPYPFG